MGLYNCWKHTSYNSLLAMMYMKLRGIKYILNCDGGIFYKNESSVKKLLKKFFVSSAEIILVQENIRIIGLNVMVGKKIEFIIIS